MAISDQNKISKKKSQGREASNYQMLTSSRLFPEPSTLYHKGIQESSPEKI